MLMYSKETIYLTRSFILALSGLTPIYLMIQRINENLTMFNYLSKVTKNN